MTVRITAREAARRDRESAKVHKLAKAVGVQATVMYTPGIAVEVVMPLDDFIRLASQAVKMREIITEAWRTVVLK